MATVHLLCGKICSGKSHLAKKLCLDGALSLSLDELTLSIFPEYMGDSSVDVFEAAKRYLLKKALEAANLGTDIVLDWGFWHKAERTAVRQMFRQKGHDVKLYFMDLTENGRTRLLSCREKELSGDYGDLLPAYHADEVLLLRRDPEFQPPTEDEWDYYYLDGEFVK